MPMSFSETREISAIMQLRSCTPKIHKYFDEVDLLLKEEGEISAIEIKSSQTYSPSFEDSLKKLSGWIHTPVQRKSVVYAGEFENTAGDIEVVNYRNLKL